MAEAIYQSRVSARFPNREVAQRRSIPVLDDNRQPKQFAGGPLSRKPSHGTATPVVQAGGKFSKPGGRQAAPLQQPAAQPAAAAQAPAVVAPLNAAPAPIVALPPPPQPPPPQPPPPQAAPAMQAPQAAPAQNPAPAVNVAAPPAVVMQVPNVAGLQALAVHQSGVAFQNIPNITFASWRRANFARAYPQGPNPAPVPQDRTAMPGSIYLNNNSRIRLVHDTGPQVTAPPQQGWRHTRATIPAHGHQAAPFDRRLYEYTNNPQGAVTSTHPSRGAPIDAHGVQDAVHLGLLRQIAQHAQNDIGVIARVQGARAPTAQQQAKIAHYNQQIETAYFNPAHVLVPYAPPQPAAAAPAPAPAPPAAAAAALQAPAPQAAQGNPAAAAVQGGGP